MSNHPRHVARAALVALATFTGLAHAQRSPEIAVAGRYAATFSLVASNCKDSGMNLTRATIDVGEPAKGRVEVSVPMVPLMKGVVSRGGKFKAEAKRGKTGIQGAEGQFSIAGRVEGATVQLLFIAEYFQGGKAFCTQSWNASGPKT